MTWFWFLTLVGLCHKFNGLSRCYNVEFVVFTYKFRAIDTIGGSELDRLLLYDDLASHIFAIMEFKAVDASRKIGCIDCGLITLNLIRFE